MNVFDKSVSIIQILEKFAPQLWKIMQPDGILFFPLTFLIPLNEVISTPVILRNFAATEGRGVNAAWFYINGIETLVKFK